MEPLVYFVLINYNGYQDTEKCVKSILNIKYKNYKILIIDNASTDESVKRLELLQSNQVILVKSKENLGFSGGNNVGIKIAKNDDADFVVLLNNDTIVTEDFLKPLIDIARINSAITTPKIMYAKEKNKIWYDGGIMSFKLGRSWHKNINKIEENIGKDVEEVSFISGCCMCIPRDIIEKIGDLNEEYFLYYEDTEYCCRAMEKGIKLLYVPNSLIYHNVSSSTGHNSPIMTYYKIRNRLYFIKRHVPYNYLAFAKSLFMIEVIIGTLIRKYDLYSIKLGIKHYKNNITGKLNE